MKFPNGSSHWNSPTHQHDGPLHATRAYGFHAHDQGVPPFGSSTTDGNTADVDAGNASAPTTTTSTSNIRSMAPNHFPSVPVRSGGGGGFGWHGNAAKNATFCSRAFSNSTGCRL